MDLQSPVAIVHRQESTFIPVRKSAATSIRSQCVRESTGGHSAAGDVQGGNKIQNPWAIGSYEMSFAHI